MTDCFGTCSWRRLSAAWTAVNVDSITAGEADLVRRGTLDDRPLDGELQWQQFHLGLQNNWTVITFQWLNTEAPTY